MLNPTHMPTVIIIGMILTTVFGIVMLIQKNRISKIVEELNNQIADMSILNVRLSADLKHLDNKLLVTQRELFNMTTQKETLSEINKELSKKMSKDEKIEVTVTGENSEVKIIDVDGKVTARKRGRKPGSKKPFYKKKSGGKPS